MTDQSNIRAQKTARANGLTKASLRKTRRGMALVITLGILVLITVLVLAFFSRAQLNRKISFSSTNLLKADSVARSASDILVGELREEIRDGSDARTASPDNATIYQPKTAADSVPQKQSGLTPDTAGAHTLLKISANGSKIYSNGRALGSSITVDKKSANGRTQNAWFESGPKLGTNSTLPTWVYLSRQGIAATPNITAKPDNSEYVIGRFAYTVYEIGGLLDVNAVGYPQTLGADTNYYGRRGNLAQVDLSAIEGMTAATSDALVLWRNAQEATSAANYTNYIATKTDGFTKPLAGDRFFLSRRDLLRYARTYGLPDTALGSLTTFNRTLNAPVVKPATVNPTNPDPTLLQFGGKPLIRFPLSRLALLARNPSDLTPSDLANIQSYFGLTPDSNNSTTWKKWTYRGGTVSTIKTLAEVAALNRQPDFFEMLQAGLVSGSLGKASGDTLVSSSGVDAKTAHQTMRIGANIIDQYDADSYPTTLVFDGLPFFGIEDLPYLNKVLLKPYWPSPQWNLRDPPVYPYVIFEMWNPHQTPSVASSAAPSLFRVRANNDAHYLVQYQGNPGTGSNQNSYPFGTTYAPLSGVGGEPIQFHATGTSFRDPGVIRDSSFASYHSDLGCNALALPTITSPVPDEWRTPTIWQNIYITIKWINTVFCLDYYDGSAWRPYNTFGGFEETGGITGINSYATGLPSRIADANGAAYQKADPRTFRFGSSYGSLGSLTTPQQFNDISLHPTPSNEKYVTQRKPDFMNSPDTTTKRYLDKLATNTEADHTYADNDGTIRPADAFHGVNPYATGDASARPIILNRPFQSVGELGYVFRDQPWKTLDFFEANSGDSALMDLFTVNDAEVVGGSVDLNSASSETLTAMVNGTALQEYNTGAAISNAQGVADQLTTLQSTPFLSRSELVSRLVGSSSFPATGGEGDIKTQREAAARALGSMTSTRTWNLLIDVVAQSGNFPPTATTADKFTVDGERRYWLSVAIDRYTGKVISRKLEGVYND